MKIFKFFVVENLMVAGLPLCDTNFDSIPDRFGDATFVTVTCRQPFLNPFDNRRVLPNTPDIEPPMIKEVNGFDMTELEYHEWRESISDNIQGVNGTEEGSLPCHCPDVELWKSSDSNDGTGDHEAFM